MSEQKSRTWAFTKYGDEWTPRFDNTSFGKTWVSYAVWQREQCPKTGRPHYQGTITFSNSVRRCYVQCYVGNTTHCEPAINVEKSEKYCMKEETRIDGPWEYGDKPDKQGKRTDLLDIKKLIDEKKPMTDVAEASFGDFIRYHRGFDRYKSLILKPRDPSVKAEVKYFVGETGTGKTRRAWDLAAEKGWTIYMKEPGNRWWDGYEQQDIIVIDDISPHKPGEPTMDYWLRVIDRYPYAPEVKGGSVQLNSKMIIFTSNFNIRELWPQVRNIDAFERRIDEVVVFPERNGSVCG